MFKFLNIFANKNKYELKKEFQEIKIPNHFNSMHSSDLRVALNESVLSPFKVINYTEKTIEEMYKKDWTHWDMCILMTYLKRKYKIDKPNIIDFVHPTIKTYPKSLLEKKINSIVMEFNKRDLNKKHAKLMKKDVSWSPYEISILIKYLLKED